MPTSATCRSSPDGVRKGKPPEPAVATIVLHSKAGPGPERAGLPASGSTGAAAGGFTLLELLVVLLLLGLATALAMPNLERLAAGITRGTERERILDQLAGLGRQAMLQRRGYVVFGTGDAPDPGPFGAPRETVDAAPGRPRGGAAEGSSGLPSAPGPERYELDLPEGWEIRLDTPLAVRANGVCLGAGLTLLHRGEVDLRVDLEPPYCRIDRDA